MDMNAYIWDLDGTLLHSYGVITESLAAALAEKGLKPDPEQILQKVKKESVTACIRESAEKKG